MELLENLEGKIEAILFALGREITIEELADMLTVEIDKIQEVMDKLARKYCGFCGINLVKVKDAYQLVTNKLYYPYVNLFVENTKRQTLSNSALEALSIIAYNPKITKTEIENIRGVNSDFAVNRLLETGLIEEVARLNLPGRPAAYAVTSEFVKSCGIETIEQLPDFEHISIKDEQLLIHDLVKDDIEKNPTISEQVIEEVPEVDAYETILDIENKEK